MKNKSFIVATKSKYKLALISNIIKNFKAIQPLYKEEKNIIMSPDKKCIYLAKEKVKSLIQNHSKSYIIASDQLLICDGKELFKPITKEKAFEQLLFMKNKTSIFYTGLAVYSPIDQKITTDYETCEIKIKNLPEQFLKKYIEEDKPYDCAGAFKIESKGIIITEYIKTKDYTSLIGFPLIKLSNILLKYNYEFF